MLRRICASAICGLMLSAAAGASADEMGDAVDRAATQMIQPAYRMFSDRAEAARTVTAALCAAPSPQGLTAARAAFAEMAMAFAAVEMFRFGPARIDNRFERLFFWPDRRGRGFRQVTNLVRLEDPTAQSPELLRQKSVAVQGLQALDYVLFAKDADTLAASPAGFRCGYASALTIRIAAVAAALNADWAGPFAAVLRTPGPGNPTFRTSSEVVRVLLQAAREQLQIVASHKISRPLGDAETAPRPQSAPLAYSGLGLAMVERNIAAVEALAAALDLRQAISTPEEAALLDELAFFLDGARLAIAFAVDMATDWPGVLAHPEAKARIAYAPLALADAIIILGEQLPAALGLIAGFNSLDGD